MNILLGTGWATDDVQKAFIKPVMEVRGKKLSKGGKNK